MATKIQASKLDFDTIKSNLKSFLSQHSDFTDYDFNASGLNVMIDALAYNTHQLALISNFSLNECFLDTSQLRSSLVSHAKPLGYLPKSKTAPRATIDVQALSVPSGTSDLTLPKYSEFTTTIDSTAYTYVTLNDTTATEAGGYLFDDVIIAEGKVVTKKFFIDGDENNYPVYVIPTTNIDTSTISVILRDGVNSTSITSLTLASNISSLTSTSDIYLLNESPNGFYELTLGDDVIGKKPDEGQILEVTYVITNGKDSNGALNFATSVTVSGFSLSVSLVSKSSGGDDKESLESIRFNAPLTFAAQNRLVTQEDFKSFITNNTSFVDAINIWGGADNVPPEYGAVFISIKPTGADTITSSQQKEIETLLSKKSVLNITPKFTDPVTQYFDITANIKYDPNKTSLSEQQLNSQIATTISDFGTTNLKNFGSVFYKSNLMTTIDASDASIISSDVTINVRNRFFPTLGALDSYVVKFTSDIKDPSTSTGSVVTSTGFTYTVNGVTYTAFLRNKPGSNTLELFRTSGSTTIIILANAGSISSTDNKILNIGPFQPTAFINTTKGIELIAELKDDISISPLRNILLQIDPDATAVNSTAIS